MADYIGRYEFEDELEDLLAHKGWEGHDANPADAPSRSAILFAPTTKYLERSNLVRHELLPVPDESEEFGLILGVMECLMVPRPPRFQSFCHTT